MKPNLTLAAAHLLAAFAVINSNAAAPASQSKHLAVDVSPARPAFRWFFVNSLGQGKLATNPVLVETNAGVSDFTPEDRHGLNLAWLHRTGEENLEGWEGASEHVREGTPVRVF